MNIIIHNIKIYLMASYYQANKTHLKNYRHNLTEANKESKKYYCRDCNIAYRDKTQLDRHLRSKKHNHNYKRYKCPFTDCSYENNAQYHLTIHLNSRKHRGVEIPVNRTLSR